MSDLKYCSAPWRGLHISQSGDVKFCCAGKSNALGNLNFNTLEECLQGSAAQQIRQEVKQGNLSNYCQVCIESEKFGGSSERDWHNSVSHDFNVSDADLCDHVPAIVDVRWNTTCNLRCQYCNSNWSSQWAAYLGHKVNHSVRSYNSQICDYVGQHTSNIREVALVGGEPLLLPDNIKFLDNVPDTAIVTLITNLSVDLDSNKIFQKLQTRQRVGWSISFDNIGERFEFVRRNADWQVFLHNLTRVQTLWQHQQQWGGAHAVFNIFNATRLCEFREFLNSRNLTVVWQTLISPEQLDPACLGHRVRELVVKEIDKLLQSVSITEHEYNYFNEIKKSYQTKEFDNHIPQFQAHIASNKDKFCRLWPELSFLADDT